MMASSGRALVQIVLVVMAIALLLAGTAGALVLSVRGLPGDEGDSRRRAPDALHVHGLARNPADGMIYLASHTGVLRVDESGEATRVADRSQDTKAFTVTGPDEFLAGGHPDLREGGGPRLGLLRSTDAARTWKAVSLVGRSDLHAIVAAHELVYASDATASRLLVSDDDGETWDVRGPVATSSLAVSPTDPDRLVAVDPVGRLLGSDDGGRTWTVVDGPTLVAVGWDATSGLFGLADDGVVWRGDSTAAHWERAGPLGRPGAALLVIPEAVYVATDTGEVLRSIDGGRTWDA